MTEEEYGKMDEVISTTLINFIIEDKRNGGLLFKDFTPSNMNHLFGFEVAAILSMSINKPFYLDMNWFDYLLFKLRNWKMKTVFKRANRKLNVKPMELEEILKYMKTAQKLEDDIYGKIYKEYYEESAKNRSIYRWKRKR